MTDRERIAELEARQQELLAAMVRLTRETPYPEEVSGREALIAEVGTLRARVNEIEASNTELFIKWNHAMCERDDARAALCEACDLHDDKVPHPEWGGHDQDWDKPVTRIAQLRALADDGVNR